MEKIVIYNVKAVLTANILNGATVVVEQGKIIAITQEKVNESNCYLVDGQGRYLSPGFIDLHTHGRMMADTMDNDRASLVKISRDLLQHGVTGYLITTRAMPLDYTLKVLKTIVDYIKDPDPKGARPLGIYLEGPYLSDEKKGAQTLDNDDVVSIAGIKALLDAGEGHVKVVALAPELAGADEAIKIITSQGVIASIAHTMSTYEQGLAAIEAGATLATHTFNAMRQLDHKEPGVIAACLNDSRVICEAIVDGYHLHPAIVQLMYQVKGAGKIALISDSVAAVGIPDGDYDYGGRQFTVSQGTVRLADGGLAGSLLSLDAAVRNVRKFTGCSLSTAVEMASLSPAKVIKQANEIGSLEVGKTADLIIFDDDIRIYGAVVNGKYQQIG